MRSHYDAIIVGSGFGGSVSALRLSEKGYSVLVIEKGRRFEPGDFPKSTWDVPNFLWAPAMRWFGPFKMTFFRHVTILSGVGVGGGSLVYANTLPIPKPEFFSSGSWAGIADWQTELEPYYATAKRMLGAEENPKTTLQDAVLQEIAEEMGRGDDYHPTTVGVYFGDEGQTVGDPYFDGKGPSRTGCVHCGGCMLGCQHNAKNTLDKNYLYLAERLGAEVLPETLVTAVRARPEGGYRVQTRSSTSRFRRHGREFTADKVVLSGGVLGTVDLLLDMKDDPKGLPKLSKRVGQFVRTNNESLIGVTTKNADLDLTEGVAITSIFHTDDHSHVEPVRYSKGSGFFRTMALPHAPGKTLGKRLRSAVRSFRKDPAGIAQATTVRDWAKSTLILLYMRSLEGTLSFEKGPGGMRSVLSNSEPPSSSIPEASEIAERVAEKIDGVAMSMFTETLLDIPTTAHILGGACMGRDAEDGVIGEDHQVHGYPGLYVCDGSAVSANPGVNPSLTITAMTERAMSKVPAKS